MSKKQGAGMPAGQDMPEKDEAGYAGAPLTPEDIVQKETKARAESAAKMVPHVKPPPRPRPPPPPGTKCPACGVEF